MGEGGVCLPDNAAGLQAHALSAAFGAAANTGMPKVAILLCTCRGQNYLAEQLDSFEAQTHANWEVWASDDGSKDATRDIEKQPFISTNSVLSAIRNWLACKIIFGMFWGCRDALNQGI